MPDTSAVRIIPDPDPLPSASPPDSRIVFDRLALTANDAAGLLGISRAQFWKLHASGKLPVPVYLGVKAPRWRAEELRDWLAAGCPDRVSWLKLQEGAR